MKKLNFYETPAVIREVTIFPDSDILQVSVVDSASITSVGQEVDTYDFGSDNSFNTTWE